MQPLMRRRPLRNAVRMLLGFPAMQERRRTRAWARGQASPDSPQQATPARSTYISPTDDVASPTPTQPLAFETEPVTPMAPAVQPTGNAMAVASETDLDAPPTPFGNGMRLADAQPAMVVSGSRLFADTPPGSPRPATIEVQIPQRAPMVRAVNAQPKKPSAETTTPVSQPRAAPQASNATTPRPSRVDSMYAQAESYRQQAAQLQQQFNAREQQFARSGFPTDQAIMLQQQQATIDQLNARADALDARADNAAAQAEALGFARDDKEHERNKPQDTLKGNRQMFAETVAAYGIAPAVESAMMGWQSDLDGPPDPKVAEAQRQIFTQDALSAVYADGLRRRQPPVKGDYFTVTLADLAYKRFPGSGASATKARKALVGSVVGAGMVASKVRGEPTLGIAMTENVSRIVEELIAEMQ